MAEKKVIELEVKTEGLGSLKSQLRQAQEQVTQLSEKFGATSQEAINAAKRAAELKDAIGDAKALTDAFNPDAKFNALSTSIGGVLNGFQAFEGALGLIGVESSAVQETLLKVQSAMALSQGIQGLMEAKDSFKQLGAVISQTALGQKLLTAAQVAGAAAMRILNTVMAANPVLLIVAGIGALVGALAIFTRDTETAAEANDRLNASLERMNESVEATNKKLIKAGQDRLKILESQGASEEVLHKQRLKNIDNEEKARKYALKAEEETLKHKRAAYKQALEEEDYELAKTIQGEIKSSQKRYKDLINQHTDYTTNKIVENNNFNREQQEELKKQTEDQAKAEKEAQEKRKKIRDDAYQQKKSEWEKEIQDSNNSIDEINKIITNRVKKEDDLVKHSEMSKSEWAEENAKFTNKLRQDLFNDSKGFLEAELTQNQYNFDAKLQLLDLQKQQELANKDLTEGEITAIEARYSKARKDIQKEEQAYKIQSIQTGLNVISNLNQLFAGKGEAQQKKAFQIQKAVNIASAVMDTYKAANAALASAPPPFNFIQMAAVITAGLLNVKNIASQKFEGGGSSGGGGASMGASATSAPSVITPNFNIVGNAQATNPLAGLGNQPIQAYVVSGDVTTAQSLDRNRINYATFG